MNDFSQRWIWEDTGRVSALDIDTAGGLVLAGFTDGRLIGFDPEWGQPRWQTKLPEAVREVRAGGDWNVALTTEGTVAVLTAWGEISWVRRLEFSASCFDLRPGSNMLFLGNGYRLWRQVSVKGSIIGRGDASHPIDYVRYAPGGRHTVLACADGHVTLLDYGGKPLWTLALKQQLLGADAADRAATIVLPARKQGVVTVDVSGTQAALIEMPAPVLAAEIDDDGTGIVALDAEGFVSHFDLDGVMFSHRKIGSGMELMALDSAGVSLALAGASEPGRCRVMLLRKSVGASGDRATFIEVGSAGADACPIATLKTGFLETEED